ncbi:S-adenosyl-methyltransferase [Candidatus Kinetoplastibacterium desouzaii TCC079E]|uniref:Ribosomal RNA small subunit methyltransferase H n=1 Tax=Candidatus Kinetoplastidibacterium desouzai TCC079E TaxID=1208919 RepID=M1M4J0_9PROT|nr:16S rRNA (cytosine(1402)-N(4))-methyltransferase RsmH [Candidatus Kinetoplastibacterium desouzaii]AGF47125.1 S-adenosyl-methyltransferase [Candidatus Kinetoplastibacterium desouzaii TCC079E]
MNHKPVLLKQTISSLLFRKSIKKNTNLLEKYSLIKQKGSFNGIFVDGTFGRGGHTKELLSFLDSDSMVFVFDKDPEAIVVANDLAKQDNRVNVIHNSFACIKEELYSRNVNYVDGIMLDLGISSPQIERGERGFSFMRDGPLDMRMDNTKGITVSDWIQKASLNEIKDVLSNYGEERFALQIAKAIIAYRDKKPFTSTFELSECISKAIPIREKCKHPATRSFQALRIHINNELLDLSKCLKSSIDLLNPAGVLSVISFHSLEDRIVKKSINSDLLKQNVYIDLPIYAKDIPEPSMRSVLRIFPSKEEINENPRSRSAVLRVSQKSY